MPHSKITDVICLIGSIATLCIRLIIFKQKISDCPQRALFPVSGLIFGSGLVFYFAWSLTQRSPGVGNVVLTIASVISFWIDIKQENQEKRSKSGQSQSNEHIEMAHNVRAKQRYRHL